VVFIFVFGWQGYMHLKATPAHAHEIYVEAHQWKWGFRYENGYEDDVLHVPVNEPVRLVMKSSDVLHSFFVPAFRVKQDVIPGRYTDIWFEATEAGTYRLYCAEYCGTDHSQMKTFVKVHEAGGFEKYLDEGLAKMMNLPPVELGKLLYEKKGCKQCHSIDGSSGKGPTWKGIFGQTHTMTDGSQVLVDENYIRESILNSTAKVRSGFNPIMPVFQGKINDRGVQGLIAYIKSLK
ncbi:MAG TPA: c-type cytochrome, partial [Kofleriaceae bacterium]|nr:c-type cytochrome [Kofleriaceae bacterium]